MNKEDIEKLKKALQECRVHPDYDYAAIISKDEVWEHDPNKKGDK